MGQNPGGLKYFRNLQSIDTTEPRYAEGTSREHILIVRINGTLPDVSILGSESKSERAEEVRRQGIRTNTSCSLYARVNHNHQVFHVLVDIGEGVTESIKKGPIELGFSSSATVPDALLITHSHDDHVKELPILLQKIIDNNDLTTDLKIFCTLECWDQVVKKFPQLSNRSNKGNIISFVGVEPNRAFEVGPFSVTPVLAYHGDNSPVGSVIIY
jgi:phosphoribosyl 1,2-cyclic phosphodiesterase